MIANRSSRVCIYTGRWNRFIKSWREVIIGAEIGGWDRWIKERDEIDRESGSECLSPSRYDGHVSCIREKNCDKSELIIIRQWELDQWEFVEDQAGIYKFLRFLTREKREYFFTAGMHLIRVFNPNCEAGEYRVSCIICILLLWFLYENISKAFDR